MKFRYYQQYDVNDCAPTCIRMICAHYGRKFPIELLREKCDISRCGVTVRNVVKGLQGLHFSAKVIKIQMKHLSASNMPLPAILYWQQRHFVVLYDVQSKVNGTKFFIANPSLGKEVLEEVTFKEHFCDDQDEGVAILVDPTEDFYVQSIAENDTKSFRLFHLTKETLKKHKKTLSISFLFTLIAMVANWIIPILLQYMIDKGVNGKDMHVVFWFAIVQLVLFVSYTLSNYISNLFSTCSNFGIGIDLMKNYLYKLAKLPIMFFDTKINSDLIQLTEDQERIKNFLTTSIPSILLAFCNWIAFSLILIHYSLSVFVLSFLFSIFSVAWFFLFLHKQRVLEYKKFTVASEQKSRFYELINGMKEIKMNSAQVKKVKEIEENIHLGNRIFLQDLNLNFYIHSGLASISKLKDILIVTLCAWFIIHERMTIGEMITITYLLGQVSAPLLQLISFGSNLQFTKISMERVCSIQNLPDENNEQKQSLPIALDNGIEFKNVYFKYAGDFPYVINNISCHIPSKKVTAIVGESGSGKSTFLKILAGFYYPQLGDIQIEGIPMNRLNTEEWRCHCGVVMQDGYLFSGTLLDNIAIADSVPSLEKAKHAAYVACIDDFIDSLPMGYYTNIGNMGIELSGGQRQRLLIARAVYKDPEFIFLDEATSFLDVNNEKKIMKNLQHFFLGRTVVIIAHRLSTVRDADNILFLSKGKLVEQGTHEELENKKGPYFQLVKNQLFQCYS